MKQIQLAVLKCLRALTTACKLKESSVGIATVLCPYLSYQLSAKIAKAALREKRSVRDLVLEHKLMAPEKLDLLLGNFIKSK